MITAEFTEQVQALRDEGHIWTEVARITGRSERTCKRALHVGQPIKECAERGCHMDALRTGQYCRVHASKRQGHNTEGPRQKEVMRLMRKHGMLTAERLRTLTTMDSASLYHVVNRLVHQGKLERPIVGHYRLPQR